MKLTILLSAVMATSVVLGQAPGKAAMNAEAARAQRLALSGGLLERPGSVKGRIVFIDTQTRLGGTNLQAAVKLIQDAIGRYQIEVVKAKPGQPAALKAGHGADVAVILVADEATPAILAAPEDHWAVMNVNALLKNLKTANAQKKFFESRCRKEIVRAFACAAGGIGSSYPGNIMDTSAVEDLDVCQEFIPFDKVSVFKSHLGSMGLAPRKFATYRAACRDGWAPAPTNEVQKGIWEKAKADKERGPTNPIKILPPGGEGKKGAGRRD